MLFVFTLNSGIGMCLNSKFFLTSPKLCVDFEKIFSSVVRPSNGYFFAKFRKNFAKESAPLQRKKYQKKNLTSPSQGCSKSSQSDILRISASGTVAEAFNFSVFTFHFPPVWGTFCDFSENANFALLCTRALGTTCGVCESHYRECNAQKICTRDLFWIKS